MSMDNPNEYERSIELYAAAVREQAEAERLAKLAVERAGKARDDRQEAWRAGQGLHQRPQDQAWYLQTQS